jgi:hypothetical protein
LDENVWPVLSVALEKLLGALKARIPKSVRETRGDASLRPEDAVDFHPLLWLANYLKHYNPARPNRFSAEEAAVAIQALYRGHCVRRAARVAREQAEAEHIAREQATREARAAARIQALFRGHSVRVAIALGKDPSRAA